MPNSYVHLVCCNPKLLENRSFVIGNEAPHLLKVWFKQEGMDKTRVEYLSIQQKDMPAFCTLEERISQKERWAYDSGLHFGKKDNPHIDAFWQALSPDERKSDFWRGYLWHLLTDMFIHSKLALKEKLDSKMRAFEGSQDQKEFFLRKEASRMNDDWRKVNSLLLHTYPEVNLTHEIRNLDEIHFICPDTLDYIYWPDLKDYINYLRSFNPLSQDIEKIMREIQGKI